MERLIRSTMFVEHLNVKASITLNPDRTVVRASLHRNDDEHVFITD